MRVSSRSSREVPYARPPTQHYLKQLYVRRSSKSPGFGVTILSQCSVGFLDLERLDRSEHVCRVPRNFDLAPDPADGSLSVDEERGPFHAHVTPAIHALFDPHAIG